MTTKDKSPRWRGESPEKAAREPPPRSDGHQPHDQRPCRMRREISKSRPSHAEMKSKKSCSKSSLLRPLSQSPRHPAKDCSPAAASGFMPPSKPLSTLPETCRVKASADPVKLGRFSLGLAASTVVYVSSRVVNGIDGFEAAACGMVGRLCFRCQKIPQTAKRLSLQLQIDGCKLGQPWLLQSSLAIMSALAMGVKLSMSSPRDASSGLR